MAFINKEQVKEIREALEETFPEIEFEFPLENFNTVNVGILKSPYDFSDIPNFSETCSTMINHESIPHCIHKNMLTEIVRLIKTGSDRKWKKEICFGDYIKESFFINLYVGHSEKGYEREVL